MTDELIKRLKNGEEFARDEDGNLVAISVKPSTLAVIAKFLKDNHVEPGVPDPKLEQLNKMLSGATDKLEDYELY